MMARLSNELAHQGIDASSTLSIERGLETGAAYPALEQAEGTIQTVVGALTHLWRGKVLQMTAVLLSLLDVVAQALPGGARMTVAEGIVVSCALLSVIVVGLWVRNGKRK
jgi:hypothetical protein